MHECGPFQYDVESETVDLEVEFILDGSHKDRMFPVYIYLNPTLVVYEDRVDDYVPIWPCKHDYIHIEVGNFVNLKVYLFPYVIAQLSKPVCKSNKALLWGILAPYSLHIFTPCSPIPCMFFILAPF